MSAKSLQQICVLYLVSLNSGSVLLLALCCKHVVWFLYRYIDDYIYFLSECLCFVRGSHWFWKVLKFDFLFFRTWEVLKLDMGGEKVMQKFWFFASVILKNQDTESIIFFSNICA